MKKLTYLFLALIIVACSSDDSRDISDVLGGPQIIQSPSCNGENPIYLADNGVTIIAKECAEVLNTGVINGVMYVVVDLPILKSGIELGGNDLTVVVTSRITDMNNLFAYASAFNQDIGGWNTSSVTNMSAMFESATAFNQDLSGWCVTNITSKQNNFDYDTPAWTLLRPIWGTCPQ